MATKQYLDLTGLTTYDGLIKEYIGTEDAKSIKSLSISGNTVSFYKTNDASGTAAYTVNLPDVSGFMDKITSATGGKIVTSTSAGQVVESETAISDLATNAYVGQIPGTAEATTIVGYIDEAVASGGEAGEVFLVDAQTPTTGYLKTYELYQGGTAAGNLVGKIDLFDIDTGVLTERKNLIKTIWKWILIESVNVLHF